MLTIVGIFVVFLAVMGGYKLEGGNLSVLFQPAELLIIGGAALGSFLIASPRHVRREVFRNLPLLFKKERDSKQIFLDILLLLFALMTRFRREGAIPVEVIVNEPERSALFKKYPRSSSGRNWCVSFATTLSFTSPSMSIPMNSIT
jgi:chemotaxis protein MotA